MEHLIEVAFKGNRREFFTWAFEAPPPARAAIIVDVERGEDLGRVYAAGELAERRKAGTTHGKEQREPLRSALRLATADDIARAEVLRNDEEHARRYAVQKARALGLQMKVSDAEWQWDRRRLTFYFTAEERVDFRALVRQLESHFGVRVQMWHIGPRDEAKRLDGVGHCGRQLCSAAWLPELLPVKTSLAKEQRLSTITPTQISGACGRLMCCLRYEHEFYVQARKRFPKQGKIVQTLEGEEKVDSTDIFRDLVTLRNPAGDLRTIPLAQFRRELAGETMPVEDEPHDADDESGDEGDERAAPTERTPSARSASPGTDRRERPTASDERSGSRGDQRRDARPGQGRPAPRTEQPRAEQPRGDQRRDPRRDQRRDASPDQRTPRAGDQRQGARDTSPSERASADATPATGSAPHTAAAPAVASTPAPAPLPSPQTGTPADATAQDSGDAEHRRRRRRGRRGGRRHRGDGPRGQGDATDGTPTNSDS